MGTNIFINNPGHIITMATMSKYGKKLSKTFSRTAESIDMKLDMLHWGLEYCNVSINHYGKADLGHICKKLLKCHLKGKKTLIKYLYV